MDLRQIRYFVTVARERNFTRAAHLLHISQPPLSRQIQALEEELGVRLLSRTSRPLQLTQAGKLFYEQSLQLLSRVEQMKRATRLVGKNERTILSIGFVPSTLYGDVPGMVQRIRQRRPDIDVQLVELLSVQQPEALRTGRIDVAFGRIRTQAPGVARLILREERLMAAVSKNSQLAGPETEALPLESLKGQRLLLYPKEPRPNFADQVLSTLHDSNLYPDEIQEVNELQTALGLVAADVGLCIVPGSVRSMRRDICYRLLGDDRLTSPVILSYRANDSSQNIDMLLDILAEVYAEQPPWIEYSINRLKRP